MIARLQQLIKWLLRFLSRKKPTYQLIEVDDIPIEPFPNDHIYLVGVKEHKWCIVFTCPCGCSEQIILNMLESSKPRWTVEKNSKNDFSIFPSIHRKVGCKAHFFIRHSDVIFV